jgi:glycosyltransferase involved in cell wall biosynthesis
MISSSGPHIVALSLVIPCYNEEGNIPNLYARAKALVSQNPNFEVIFVNNGSSDSTGRLLEKLTEGYSGIEVVNVETNKGYGHGIKMGLRSSKGAVVGWTHADLQTDPMDALIGLTVAGESIERTLIKGLRIKRPLMDSFFTIGMSVFESLLFRIPLRDVNAQPTLFSRPLLDKVLEGPDDFSLDLFALVSAAKRDYRQVRFPVHFGPRFSGKSKWNTSVRARWNFIKRTVIFSFALAEKTRK